MGGRLADLLPASYPILFFQFRAEESRLSEPYAVKIDKNEKMLDFDPPEVYTQRIKIQMEE